jgi:hypothetical protein
LNTFFILKTIYNLLNIGYNIFIRNIKFGGFKMNDKLLEALNEPDYLKLMDDNISIEKNPITIYFEKQTSNDITDMLNVIKNNTNINISKSILIETATKYFLSLLKSSNTINNFFNNENSIDHQIIIFTSSNKNNYYNERFLGNNKHGQNYWIQSNLGKDVIELINYKVIRYISLYKGTPFKYCDEFGQIERVEQININNLDNDDICDIGKYRIIIKNDIIKLPNKIILEGNRTSVITRGKKSTLRKFLTSTYIEQL